jgi:hypothetical protein
MRALNEYRANLPIAANGTGKPFWPGKSLQVIPLTGFPFGE